MKRPIVLLSLLFLMMMFTAQLSVTGMEGRDQDAPITPKQGNDLEDLSKRMEFLSFTNKRVPFKEGLNTILNDYRNDRDSLKIFIKDLYDSETELKENLIQGGTFSQNDLGLFFDIAQELTLPIIALTDSYSVLDFSFYKGQSIQDITQISFDGTMLPDNKKLTTVFVSEDFTYLEEISLCNNLLSNLKLPSDLPNLYFLDLSYNQLTQVNNLHHAKYINFLDLSYNRLTQANLPAMPQLLCLKLSGNRLTQLNLPAMPELSKLDLSYNRLIEVNLHDASTVKMLNLRHNNIESLSFLKNNMSNLYDLNLENNPLENNPLKKLTMPYKVSHHTGLVNEKKTKIRFHGKIREITAYYCPPCANTFGKDPDGNTFGEGRFMDYAVLSRKKHIFRRMDFTNYAQAERNWDKIHRWMVAGQR